MDYLHVQIFHQRQSLLWFYQGAQEMGKRSKKKKSYFTSFLYKKKGFIIGKNISVLQNMSSFWFLAPNAKYQHCALHLHHRQHRVSPRKRSSFLSRLASPAGCWRQLEYCTSGDLCLKWTGIGTVPLLHWHRTYLSWPCLLLACDSDVCKQLIAVHTKTAKMKNGDVFLLREVQVEASILTTAVLLGPAVFSTLLRF